MMMKSISFLHGLLYGLSYDYISDYHSKLHCPEIQDQAPGRHRSTPSSPEGSVQCEVVGLPQVEMGTAHDLTIHWDFHGMYIYICICMIRSFLNL